MSGVKLGWKSEDQIHRETVTIPIVAGLVVVIVTVLGLYLFREGRAIRASLGTSRVVSGGKSVRRSKRQALYTQLQPRFVCARVRGGALHLSLLTSQWAEGNTTLQESGSQEGDLKVEP